jgi:hypothetical protein
VIPGCGACATFKEQADHFGVALENRGEQRGASLFVSGFNIGARIKQQFRDLKVSVLRCPVQSPGSFIPLLMSTSV